MDITRAAPPFKGHIPFLSWFVLLSDAFTCPFYVLSRTYPGDLPAGEPDSSDCGIPGAAARRAPPFRIPRARPRGLVPSGTLSGARGSGSANTVPTVRPAVVRFRPGNASPKNTPLVGRGRADCRPHTRPVEVPLGTAGPHPGHPSGLPSPPPVAVFLGGISAPPWRLSAPTWAPGSPQEPHRGRVAVGQGLHRAGPSEGLPASVTMKGALRGGLHGGALRRGPQCEAL